MELVKYEELISSWQKIAKSHKGEAPLDFELEIHKKLLNLFHVGDFYYYIFNIPNVKIEFVSNSVGNIIGIAPEEFTVTNILALIHPDDKNRFIDFENKVSDFFVQLPADKVLKYKVSYDYRVKTSDGNYKWILQQVTTIQTNENGSVIRVLGVHTDVTHIKNSQIPSGLSFIGLDGEPSFHNANLQPKNRITSPIIFTKREKEILQHVLNGFTSAQIAEQLHISIHTVCTHRKNILQKANVKSNIELVAKAIENTWV